MTAEPLWCLDAVELAERIRRREVSARQVMDAHLARMDAVNPQLNAVVLALPEQARAEADAADAALARGDAVGPLHGVPVTIKVNTDQAGCPTDNGVVALKDLVAERDSPTVGNFRKAGAIVIGRTNTPCLSMRWTTENSLHGNTLNPWDPARTPGGSSGGAGAATASGIAPINQGNDIAGSVRYPAYCCGVVGLRPSYGRVPARNYSSPKPRPISAQLMAVQGPLTRTVRDARLALRVMAAGDVGDARWVDAPLEGPPAPKRVALVPDPAGRGVQPAIRASVLQAGSWLAEAGYEVEEVEPPRLGEVADLWARMAMADTIRSLDATIEQVGDEGIRRAIGFWHEVMPKCGPQDTLDALAERDAMLQDWQDFLERWPVVVMPNSAEPAFRVGEDLIDVETTRRLIAAQLPQLAIPVLGLPAVSVPTGTHDGLPMGVQIVAGRFREDLCLAAAEAVEVKAGMTLPIDPKTA
ncbi:amidase [Thalassobaculum fulvum]|uniref:Amidase n=1 Tax=Thalassobaculum fulvum TaxID=1633335 RepID=A0A918XWK1_9PROT|nr:amidase family protein [Thalassobaculum fulvum]GHD61544.1 amidase [Thalassobaculum fulvum]